MTLDLEVFPTKTWAEETATRFTRVVTERPTARLCLPTGDTVVPFYRNLAGRVDLSQATVFLLDEFGGLPTGDPGRCETMIRTQLLDHTTPVKAFHRPDVDADDPAAEAGRYQTLLDDGGLDLTLLGLGQNGHIGMNEPGSARDDPTRVVSLAASTIEHAAEAYGAGGDPTWGITVGMAPILSSDQVWLMVTGEEKAGILARVMSAKPGPDLPASFLKDHPNAVVLADEPAAACL